MRPGTALEVICPKLRRAETVAGFIELRVIEQVEEFRPELKTGVFPQSTDDRVLDDRRIEVDLRAAPHDSDTGVAEACAAPEELRSRGASVVPACNPLRRPDQARFGTPPNWGDAVNAPGLMKPCTAAGHSMLPEVP